MLGLSRGITYTSLRNVSAMKSDATNTTSCVNPLPSSQGFAWSEFQTAPDAADLALPSGFDAASLFDDSPTTTTTAAALTTTSHPAAPPAPAPAPPPPPTPSALSILEDLASDPTIAAPSPTPSRAKPSNLFGVDLTAGRRSSGVDLSKSTSPPLQPAKPQTVSYLPSSQPTPTPAAQQMMPPQIMAMPPPLPLQQGYYPMMMPPSNCQMMPSGHFMPPMISPHMLTQQQQRVLAAQQQQQVMFMQMQQMGMSPQVNQVQQSRQAPRGWAGVAARPPAR